MVESLTSLFLKISYLRESYIIQGRNWDAEKETQRNIRGFRLVIQGALGMFKEQR